MSLIEIFKNDGNVHVDDNHVINYDEWDKVDNCHERVSTIPVWKVTIVGVTIGWGDQKGGGKIQKGGGKIVGNYARTRL